MAQPEIPRGTCLIAIPAEPEFDRVREAVIETVEAVGFDTVEVPTSNVAPAGTAAVFSEVARADLVVSDVTGADPSVAGINRTAAELNKPIVLIARSSGSLKDFPYSALSPSFLYRDTAQSLTNLKLQLRARLLSTTEFPAPSTGGRSTPPRAILSDFVVDWDRLEPRAFDNLLRELLTQMGFQQIEWGKGSGSFDLVAQLPRKDPDGADFKELWLISTARKEPPEMLLEMALEDPEYFLRRSVRSEFDSGRTLFVGPFDQGITVLFIVPREEGRLFESDRFLQRFRSRIEKRGFASPVRVRVWDRGRLASLIYQYPQLGYKYFSDEARARSKYRKSPEELYSENVQLTETLLREKALRIRAERDAAWKDISFSAAHKMGNPIFAIETSLDPLTKRVTEQRITEALEVIGNIRGSVEKAKSIVEQFKSLTKAQEIHPVAIPLCPMLEDSCRTARDKDVPCEIDCPEGVMVQADPERLAETFDELVANSLHWLDKPERRITIGVTAPAPSPLPDGLEAQTGYVQINYRDNGPGVPLKDKSRIFDAFFTTQTHGTGLGLALVRRIIEGHGGAIAERGLPGEGADFEIYLPAASGDSTVEPRTPSRRA